VTTGSIALLLAAACGADWYARAVGSERLELASKPLATLLVIALALAHGSGAALPWVVAALAFCWIGDVCLLPRVDRFVPGLASFLVGHLCFFAAAAAHGFGAGSRAFAVAAALALAVPLVARTILLGAVRSDPGLRVPVLVYIAAVSLLPTVVAATGSSLALAGALLFTVSDTLLGYDRFVRPLAWARAPIMMTYHLALIGLALGLT
jgi:uncharacterized membrane protein YhhN